MIRSMQIEDYDQVRNLWMSIHGFAIRSIDDSRAGVMRFIQRNPGISVVAIEDGKIVGSILCGHDGRQASFYHVCVHEDYRCRGIGEKMVHWCMERLREEGINKIALIAFKQNDVGNQFWHQEGWNERADANYYDFILNEENMTKYNQ